MGTDCHIVVVGPGSEGRLQRAVDRVRSLEARWSRFIPDSEISQLNHANGSPVVVSSETVALIANAIAAWELTDGRFDPTLGRQLEQLGYDRPFEQLAGVAEIPDLQAQTRAQPKPTRSVDADRGRDRDCGAILIDYVRSTVALPVGLSFDPGGIGKGLAADMVASEAIADGAWGVLVNLGGDLRVIGAAPSGQAWTVRIIEPSVSESELATVRLADAALATSTTRRRRWNNAGAERHHLINPDTGLPHEDGPRLVSIIAGEAWWAEVLATAAASSMLLGDAAVPNAFAAANNCCGLQVLSDGSIESFGDFERYVARSWTH